MIFLKKRKEIENKVSWLKSCNPDLQENDLLKLLMKKYDEIGLNLLQCTIYSRLSAKRIIIQHETMLDQSKAPF